MTQQTIWTGRFEFDLRSGFGWAVATIDVSVRTEIVLFFIGNRAIAVLDRDQFREWLHRPYSDLEQDDIGFRLMGDDICFTVDGSVPYSLGHETMGQFVKLI